MTYREAMAQLARLELRIDELLAQNKIEEAAELISPIQGLRMIKNDIIKNLDKS